MAIYCIHSAQTVYFRALEALRNALYKFKTYLLTYLLLYGRLMSVYYRLYVTVQVHVRSTEWDRTLMSAYCNLAGLFPPQGSQVWNEKLLWQPIPVHTVPKDLDSVSLHMQFRASFYTFGNLTRKCSKSAHLYHGCPVSPCEIVKQD